MTTNIKKDVLKIVKVLIGEQEEALAGSAIWRLTIIAVDIEEKMLTEKRSVSERINRQNAVFEKLKKAINSTDTQPLMSDKENASNGH